MPEDTRIFGFLHLPERTQKPRRTGLTMVEADVMLAVAGMNWVEDLVQWGGQWIDYFKLGRTLMFQPRELVLNKLAFLQQHKIEPYVGGTTTEAVLRLGCLERYLDELQALNIKVMELSSNATSMNVDQKITLVRKLKDRGFTVFAEVGKKLIGAGGPKGRMPAADVIREMKECLDAGAFKVVYEHTEIEEIVREDPAVEPLLEVAGEVGADNIMFEVPIEQHKVVSRYAALYTNLFGVNASMGDVTPEQLVHLECQRAGYGSRTFGRWS
jgi:phosphosulfolactate synthase